MKITLTLLFIIIGILAYDSIRMYFLFQKTLELEKNFKPFENINSSASMRILVLGDSTAVGTGSSNNIYSTAGRLSSMYPTAEVINISENGLKIAGLNQMLKKISGRFDIVVIQIGANDIIRLTGLSSVDLELQKLLTETKAISNKVIILHSGNIGESNFFPWYLKSILSSRSHKVRDIYIKNTEQYGASYVNLIDLRLEEKYYASDKLHLNDEGYGIWFAEIMKKVN